VERPGAGRGHCTETVHYLDEGEVLASVLVATQAPNQLSLNCAVAALVGGGAERSAALLPLVEEVEVWVAWRSVRTARDDRMGRRRDCCGAGRHRTGRDERQCDEAAEDEQ